MTAEMFSMRPDLACRKCGHPYGFSGEPEYRYDDEVSPDLGELVWRCRYCGFAVVTATADASPANGSTTPCDPPAAVGFDPFAGAPRGTARAIGSGSQ